MRAYATVIRFDTVYVQHFKCNLGTIRHDYPHLYEWLKNLYWNVRGFRETTDFKHIKENVSVFPSTRRCCRPCWLHPEGSALELSKWLQEANLARL